MFPPLSSLSHRYITSIHPPPLHHKYNKPFVLRVSKKKKMKKCLLLLRSFLEFPKMNRKKSSTGHINNSYAFRWYCYYYYYKNMVQFLTYVDELCLSVAQGGSVLITSARHRKLWVRSWLRSTNRVTETSEKNEREKREMNWIRDPARVYSVTQYLSLAGKDGKKKKNEKI